MGESDCCALLLLKVDVSVWQLVDPSPHGVVVTVVFLMLICSLLVCSPASSRWISAQEVPLVNALQGKHQNVYYLK